MGTGRPGALDAGADQAQPNFVGHIASSWGPRVIVMMSRPGPRANMPRCSPGGIETQMREDFAAEFGKMRVASVAGVGESVDDLGPDLRGARAQHDDPTSEKQRLFHIVGYQ